MEHGRRRAGRHLDERLRIQVLVRMGAITSSTGAGLRCRPRSTRADPTQRGDNAANVMIRARRGRRLRRVTQGNPSSFEGLSLGPAPRPSRQRRHRQNVNILTSPPPPHVEPQQPRPAARDPRRNGQITTPAPSLSAGRRMLSPATAPARSPSPATWRRGQPRLPLGERLDRPAGADVTRNVVT